MRAFERVLRANVRHTRPRTGLGGKSTGHCGTPPGTHPRRRRRSSLADPNQGPSGGGAAVPGPQQPVQRTPENGTTFSPLTWTPSDCPAALMTHADRTGTPSVAAILPICLVCLRNHGGAC